MKKETPKNGKRPDIKFGTYKEQNGTMVKVTITVPGYDPNDNSIPEEEKEKMEMEYAWALRQVAAIQKIEEYKKAEKKIPDHLKRALSGDDLTDEEKAGLTKPLSIENKKNVVKALKKVAFANDLWNDDWTDLRSRLHTLDYRQQHTELTKLLNLITAHKDAYHLRGVDNIDTAETQIRDIIRDIEKEHPEFNPDNSHTQKTLIPADGNGNTSIGLKDIFVNDQAFTKINKLLAGEKLIDENSGYWIDKTKGHKTKIVALLHDLGYKGYYKQYMPAIPSVHTIKNISKNTFGVDMSIDLIKGGTRGDNNISELRKEYFYFIDKYHP